MRIHPFQTGDSFSTFRAHRDNVVAEIEALDNDYVLKASATELEQYFVSRVSIEPLTLDDASYYIDGQKGTQIDVSRDFNRAHFGSGPAYVKGTALDIAIPFSGDEGLWRVRASTYSLSGYPEVEIRDAVVVFTVRFADDSPDPARLKSEIERQVKALSDAVGHLANDVATHNREAEQLVKAALQRKTQKARGALDAVAGLGIPIRQSSAPQTYTVPAKRLPSPVRRPSVTTETFAPEPVLDENEFVHILQVLKSMSLVIERSPGAFASLDEESIRTHFLLQLNGHYEGSATGETFNAAGKTDILIRANNRNVFVAECKFWRGAKSFNEAVDQLLGYLSWRDSKCALLMFNQTKDSSAVRQKMHEAMIARPEWRKTVNSDLNGESRYVLVKESDPGREVHVCTMLFDIPTA